MNIPLLNNTTLQGVLSTAGGTSTNWNTAYTNLVTNSAAYLLSGTTVDLGQIPVLSGNWNTAYTNLVTNSAAYLLSGKEVNLGQIPVLSGNWNSVYSTTNTNSSFWSSAYTNLVTNSAAYLLSGTTVDLGQIPVLSGNWNTAYTNLVSNSSAYLSGVDISLIVTTSGNWNSVYSTTNTNSSFWSNAYTNLVTNSASYLLSGTETETNYQYLSVSQSVLLNNNYGIDTMVGSVTAVLPAMPNYGDQAEFFDIAGTWNKNNFYVNANGKNIEQDSSGILRCNVKYGKFQLIYTTDTNQTGWRIMPYPKHDIPTYTSPPIVIL